MTRLPTDVLNDPTLMAVLNAIEARGNRAYLVGGAVRNALLGQPVDDIDIATDALPDQVTQLAVDAGLKPVPTGIEHGTVTIVANGRGFEVTTFRRDIETDGRHAVVTFSDNLAEDARRRDFTMNALYADRDGHIIDPVGGLPDLSAKTLRFVGCAERRIQEDYLRILRFFRFYAWYGKNTSPEAVAACAALKDGLARIARERIGSEVRKLLAAPDPVASIRLMKQTGVLDQILTNAEPEAVAELVEIETREQASPFWPRRLAALSVGRDCSGELRLSKDEMRTLDALARAMHAGWTLNEAGYRLGVSAATDYILLAGAKGMELPANWPDRLRLASKAKLPITARDLQPKLEGPALGLALQAAESRWIASGFALTASELIAAAMHAGDGE